MKYTRWIIFSRIQKVFFVRKGLMILSGLVILMATGVSLIAPYLYKRLVDDVMIRGHVELLYMILLGMVGAYILKVLLEALSTYTNNKLCNLTNLSIKSKLMKKFLFQDTKHIVEDIGKRFGILEEDSRIIYTFLSTHMVGFITSFFIVLIYLIAMMYINLWLGLISVILVPVAILFSKKMGKLFNKVKNELFVVTSETRTFLFDTMQQWREIKSYRVEEQFEAKYDEKLEPERKLNCKWMLYFALNNMVYLIKERFVMKILVYFIGGLFIIAKDISIGELLMFMSYMESMGAVLDQLIKSNSDFMGEKAVFDRMLEILEAETKKRKNPILDRPDVVLKNVDFSYEDICKDVFTKIDCRFIYGKKYLIVGKSGEGKSTLVKLLLGFNEADSGEILINDIPISQIDSRTRFRNMGAVMQESMFFNLSMRDNFRLLVPTATENDIKRALALVCLDSFVESLPQKLDTIIGERGVKLSGGQKQRLALARLILHNPDIIILDEATSALDSVVENKIMDNLQKMYEDKTIIIISHKPMGTYCYDYLVNVERNAVKYEELLI